MASTIEDQMGIDFDGEKDSAALKEWSRKYEDSNGKANGKFRPASPGSLSTKAGTGAVRSSDVDHARYDLMSPIAIHRYAATCAEGAAKYGDRNWELGFPVHDLLNHALAHIFKYLSGDRSEDHLGHLAWNAMAAIHSEELWPHLNKPHLMGPNCTLTEEIKDRLREFRKEHGHGGDV